MKKYAWQIDLILVLAFSFLINYFVVSVSKSNSGIIIGQLINILGFFLILLFGVYRITGFKKLNRNKLTELLNKKCTLKCFSLAILIMVMSKFSYALLIKVELIKNLDLISNYLFDPVLLKADSFHKSYLTLIIIGSLFVLVGVFAEELFFRGYLFNLQYGLYGKYTWIINGISWSLVHLFARANMIALLPTAFLLSWMYQRKKNFWIVFGAHFLINSASVYGVMANYIQ